MIFLKRDTKFLRAAVLKLFVMSFALLITWSCKAQKTQTTLPKVENHLKGELDYTLEALDLVQKQANGEDIILGKINTDGTIHFNLPEYDIKALYDSIPLQHYNFHNWFLIDSSCKDRDVFAKTPFNDVYSQKTNAIYIKKYGIYVAVLEPVSDEEVLSNNEYVSKNLAVGSKYFWFYIDRAITYKDDCIKKGFNGNYDIEVVISANIQFKKGWNFIEENLVDIQNFSRGDYHTTMPKKILFTKSSPASKKVKWILKQVADDEEIQTVKKLDNLTPITKQQFEKWAPNKLGDLALTTKEHGNPPKGERNKNTIHLIYTSKTKNKEIDLYVVDCAKTGDMEMINFSYAMENDGKEEKDIKLYIAQYSERKKATEFLYKVKDRIFVEASAVNINSEDLWEYIQKLNIEKLLKK
ncbi:MAG: hypothetical protein V3U92_12955 [Cellulophaga sp.]